VWALLSFLLPIGFVSYFQVAVLLPAVEVPVRPAWYVIVAAATAMAVCGITVWRTGLRRYQGVAS
jgi:ABC-type uncharacterized transport system permease subunit